MDIFSIIGDAWRSMSAWIEASDGMAAWVQAVGTIAAIAGTGFFASRERRIQKEAQWQSAIKSVEDRTEELSFIATQASKFSGTLLRDKGLFVLKELQTVRLSIIALSLSDVKWMDNRKKYCLGFLTSLTESLEAMTNGISIEVSRDSDGNDLINAPYIQRVISPEGLEQATQIELDSCGSSLHELYKMIRNIRLRRAPAERSQ